MSITNKTILIHDVDSDRSSGRLDEFRKYAEEFISFFHLDEKLRNLIFKSLKYGDA